MNKKIWITTIILLVVGLVGWRVYYGGPGNTGPINIGVLIPLTGGNADQGEWVKQGLELARDEINKNEKIKINLIFQDTEGNPDKGVSAYQNLVARYKMPVVITWGSGVGLALTPLVNRDKIIQMGVATAAPSYSTPGDFTFRNFPSSADESSFIVSFVLDSLNTKRVAIFKINNEYGNGSAKSFRNIYEKRGGQVIDEDVFNQGTTDFRTQLSKLKSLNPSVVFLATYPQEGGLLLRQAAQLNFQPRFVASVAILGGKAFFDAAGNFAEGLVVINSAPVFTGSSDPTIRHFVDAYHKNYGVDPGPQQLYSARSYDALNIINIALRACSQNDTECMKNYLFTVKNYHGVAGNVSFNNDGDIEAVFNAQIIKNGNFVAY